MTTTTKPKFGVECLLAALLFLCLGANAGQLPCSTIARYPANCPVNVDMKYMRVDAGSYSQCFERADYRLAPGTRNVVFRPPAPPLTLGPPPDPALVSAVIPHVESILTRTVALRNDLDQRLTQIVRRWATEKDVVVSYAHARATGPISVSFLGQPTGGNLRIRISFGADMVAKGRKRGINGIFLRAQLTFKGENLVFSATYNLNSGSVSGLRLMGGPIHVTLRVTALSVVRFRFSANVDMASYLNAQSFTIFGLDTDVPAGKFVHNGTDYGLRIKRQLRDFIESVDVTITQGGKNVRNAYLNISVGSSQLTAGSIVTAEKARPRRPAASLCEPIE